jgi:hypothetical protein
MLGVRPKLAAASSTVLPSPFGAAKGAKPVDRIGRMATRMMFSARLNFTASSSGRAMHGTAKFSGIFFSFNNGSKLARRRSLPPLQIYPFPVP